MNTLQVLSFFFFFFHLLAFAFRTDSRLFLGSGLVTGLILGIFVGRNDCYTDTSRARYQQKIFGVKLKLNQTGF